MKIIKTSKTGFCYGVERSLTITKQTKNNYKPPYYLLGMLVHNTQVNESLKNEDFIIINDLYKHLTEEATFISTAHGIHEDTKKQIIESGNILIDTTCPIVIKNNQKIMKYFKDNYDIIYFGKHYHQESLVVQDYVHVVESKQDIDNLHLTKEHIVLVNQTTMGIEELKEIEEYIKVRYPNCLIDTLICPSTSERQKEIKELLKTYNTQKDYWLVLGDKKSNNTTKLYETTKRYTINNAFISNIDEVKRLTFNNIENIIITSGTSTPNSFVDEVYNYLDNKFN